ncbi:hypothetical protein NECAME_15861 [Necator americanus]|uniref:Uncharacterized protein n=1 Tax=Necator americanus TaxID=51031 RepID=W2SFM7_NECAM|nr:hypothetical protein NECAME_15861 [Necator americanus]ETN68385.1 hypothetical protein NECAME_15861 [Necator americanus]
MTLTTNTKARLLPSTAQYSRPIRPQQKLTNIRLSLVPLLLYFVVPHLLMLKEKDADLRVARFSNHWINLWLTH